VVRKTALLSSSSEGGSFVIEGAQRLDCGSEGWTAPRCLLCLLSQRLLGYRGNRDVPNIVTNGAGRRTLKELMDSDLAKFRKDNPGVS
jgi:hypothetical protein